MKPKKKKESIDIGFVYDFLGEGDIDSIRYSLETKPWAKVIGRSALKRIKSEYGRLAEREEELHAELFDAIIGSRKVTKEQKEEIKAY